MNKYKNNNKVNNKILINNYNKVNNSKIQLNNYKIKLFKCKNLKIN